MAATTRNPEIPSKSPLNTLPPICPVPVPGWFVSSPRIAANPGEQSPISSLYTREPARMGLPSAWSIVRRGSSTAFPAWKRPIFLEHCSRSSRFFRWRHRQTSPFNRSCRPGASRYPRAVGPSRSPFVISPQFFIQNSHGSLTSRGEGHRPSPLVHLSERCAVGCGRLTQSQP